MQEVRLAGAEAWVSWHARTQITPHAQQFQFFFFMNYIFYVFDYLQLIYVIKMSLYDVNYEY